MEPNNQQNQAGQPQPDQNAYQQQQQQYQQYQQQQYQQQYQQPYYQQQPQVQYTQQVYYQQPKSNGLGMAGFVLAICALVFCWVPVVDILLWALGLIFSFIGIFKAPRGFAIAGLVISLLFVVTAVVAFMAFGAAMIALG